MRIPILNDEKMIPLKKRGNGINNKVKGKDLVKLFLVNNTVVAFERST